MTLILDAGVLYAQADRSDPAHSAVSQLLRSLHEPMVTSQVVLAEADYLVMTRLGVEVELALLDDLIAATFG